VVKNAAQYIVPAMGATPTTTSAQAVIFHFRPPPHIGFAAQRNAANQMADPTTTGQRSTSIPKNIPPW